MTVNAGGMMDIARFGGAKIGDQVILVQGTFQALDVIRVSTPTGTVVTVLDVPQPGMAEVDVDGSRRAVRTALQLNPGDRVVVDGSMTAVLGLVSRGRSSHSYEKSTGVEWDDIGGQEEAKEHLREAIEMPTRNAALFKKYGKRPVKGVLLYGPPGNGKTMLAKAAATSLARTHGQSNPQGFIYVKGPSLLSKWVGETEAEIRKLFSDAREHKRRNGYPAVVFIDEAEALLGDRSREHGINKTSVPQFLAEMDGMEELPAMFILATNRPADLDPAVVREGRIDRKVKVTRPDRATSEKVMKIHLNGRPVTSDKLATLAVDEIFKADRFLGILRGQKLTLANAVSGAMLADIAERASSRAMMEDIKKSASRPSGIKPEDIVWAVDRAQDSLKDLNHNQFAE